jgi:hypothetical protein
MVRLGFVSLNPRFITKSDGGDEVGIVLSLFPELRADGDDLFRLVIAEGPGHMFRCTPSHVELMRQTTVRHCYSYR